MAAANFILKHWVKQQTVNTACIDDGDKIYEEATVAILERLTF